MAKTIEDLELQTLHEAQRELDALGPDHVLTPDEFAYFVSKMPKMPEGWTSADDVRDFRGPLPEDDPEYQRNFGRR
ncbi:MAG TPA: hypothetical protein VEK11_16200 [Thermoanaerobaculia bacterium]|jgi:hypothetical protein|nr:hypothetical protein [Thermoanaerobaculia bacterium]